MGTSHSGAEFAGKIRKAAGDLGHSKQLAVKAGAQRARSVLAATPGVPHTVAGKKVAVTVRMVGDSAIVRFTGPAHLVDRPTKAHNIFPKQFQGTRGRGKRAQKGAGLMAAFGMNARSGSGGIKLRDGSVRHSVHHPGTKGKHFFALGKPVAARAAVSEMRKVVVDEVSKVFK